MLMDKKTQYCQDARFSQLDLQIQRHPSQNLSKLFVDIHTHRIFTCSQQPAHEKKDSKNQAAFIPFRQRNNKLVKN